MSIPTDEQILAAESIGLALCPDGSTSIHIPAHDRDGAIWHCNREEYDHVSRLLDDRYRNKTVNFPELLDWIRHLQSLRQMQGQPPATHVVLGEKAYWTCRAYAKQHGIRNPNNRPDQLMGLTALVSYESNAMILCNFPEPEIVISESSPSTLPDQSKASAR